CKPFVPPLILFVNSNMTGSVIPLSDIEHIFDRFFTVDKAHSRKLGGAGLGLSLVKSLALFVLSYAYHTESILNSKFLLTSLFTVNSFYVYVMFCWSYYFLILV
ncbi:hypothetical protein EBU71_07515, partial [bacterium]|nr:hypothetical protein [Candidatus Elulimicrobium humile]